MRIDPLRKHLRRRASAPWPTSLWPRGRFIKSTLNVMTWHHPCSPPSSCDVPVECVTDRNNWQKNTYNSWRSRCRQSCDTGGHMGVHGPPNTSRVESHVGMSGSSKDSCSVVWSVDRRLWCDRLQKLVVQFLSPVKSFSHAGESGNYFCSPGIASLAWTPTIIVEAVLQQRQRQTADRRRLMSRPVSPSSRVVKMKSFPRFTNFTGPELLFWWYSVDTRTSSRWVD